MDLRTLTLALFALPLAVTQAFAHGEDKSGPHGGFIRMPGGFHTEVVRTSKNELDVYLLDITWKNPSTKDSQVNARSGQESASCLANGSKFHCAFPKFVNLTRRGSLTVKATREGMAGIDATYGLPLKFEAVEDQHKGSHE